MLGKYTIPPSHGHYEVIGGRKCHVQPTSHNFHPKKEKKKKTKGGSYVLWLGNLSVTF
jgi:hypothetical protein